MSAGPDLAPSVVLRVFDELWHRPSDFCAESTSLISHLLERTLVWSGDPRAQSEHERGSGVIDATTDLQALLARLPIRQRETILLARRSGFTYREVAAVLGRSRAEVKRDMREGLDRLHHEITDPPAVRDS